MLTEVVLYLEHAPLLSLEYFSLPKCLGLCFYCEACNLGSYLYYERCSSFWALSTMKPQRVSLNFCPLLMLLCAQRHCSSWALGLRISPPSHNPCVIEIPLGLSYVLRGTPPPDFLKLWTLQKVFLASATPCRVPACNGAISSNLICGSDLKGSLSLSLLEGM